MKFLFKDKISLRNYARKQRQKITVKEQINSSKNIVACIKELPILIDSDNVAVYFATDGEIGLGYIIDWLWKHNKQCYAPVIKYAITKELAFVKYDVVTKLSYNKFGIAEPFLSSNINFSSIADIDVILMPLTSFDNKCRRLGMGQGYYDRVLYNIPRVSRPFLLGVAHECQKVAEVPVNEFDVTLDAVVTPKKLYLK